MDAIAISLAKFISPDSLRASPLRSVNVEFQTRWLKAPADTFRTLSPEMGRLERTLIDLHARCGLEQVIYTILDQETPRPELESLDLFPNLLGEGLEVSRRLGS